MEFPLTVARRVLLLPWVITAELSISWKLLFFMVTDSPVAVEFTAQVPAAYPELLRLRTVTSLTVPEEPSSYRIPTRHVPEPPTVLPVPSTVRSLMLTGPAVAVTATCGAIEFEKPVVTTASPALGTVITACPAFALVMPFKVSGCAIVTCSGYVFGQTSTVEPGGTPITAAEIVE